MRRLIILFSTLLFLFNLTGKNVNSLDIPQVLKPWQDWVMYDQRHPLCPSSFSDDSSEICSWSSPLKLDVNNKKAEFSIAWTLYNDSWITLPGSKKNWPKKVFSSGRPLLVTQKNELPSIYLKKGVHNIKGIIEWENRPESLNIPSETPFISLTVDGEKVESVNVDGGLLLFKTKARVVESTDEMEVAVFRNVFDDIPMSMISELNLTISGKEREVNIGRFLLENSVVMSLSSKLPAKIEKNGNIKVRVKAGKWKIRLVSRQKTFSNSFKVKRNSEGWPAHEIWAFTSNNSLRSASVTGVESVDTYQTTIPDEWKRLPAFLITEKKPFTLKEELRGDAEPPEDKISISREFWMDFDGNGFSVKDTVNGTLNKNRRLGMQDNYEMGSVSVSDKPQLITKIGAENRAVELRQGSLYLDSLSKYFGSVLDIPATGWNSDTTRLSAKINLPPGWSIIHATGVDRVSNSWVNNWNIWDIFLLLIIAVLVAHLSTKAWGAVAFLTVLLTYHDYSAPLLLWFAAIGLLIALKFIPKEKMKNFRKVLIFTFYATVAVLMINTLIFSIEKISVTIYPQLEQYRNSNSSEFAERLNRKLDEMVPLDTPQRFAMMIVAEEVEEEKKVKLEKPKEGRYADSQGSSRRSLDAKVAQSSGIMGAISEGKVFGGGGLGAGMYKNLGSVSGIDQFGNGGLGTRGFGSSAKYGMASGKVSRKGRSKIKAGGGQAVIMGAMDRNVVDAYIRRNLAKIRWCYEKQLQHDPKLFGKATISFTISKTGEVSSSKVKRTTLGNEKVESCVARQVKKIRFPKPKGGGIVIANYPFTFTNSGKDEKVVAKATPKIEKKKTTLKWEEENLNQKIQTGPSRPTWIWNSADLNWEGPVKKDHKFSLFMLSPLMTKVLNILKVALILLLILKLLSYKTGRDLIMFKKWFSKTAALTIAIPLLILGFNQTINADIPSDTLLNELQTRLKKESLGERVDCSPHCASMIEGTVKIKDNKINVELKFDSFSDLFIPLPEHKQWYPKSIKVNGKRANLIFNNETKKLSALLSKGKNSVVIEGPVFGNSVQLSFPFNIHNMKVKTPDWSVSGLVDGDVTSGTIQFDKHVRQAITKAEENYLPDPVEPFLIVTRTLTLRHEWEIFTTVTRVVPYDGPINFSIPLIKGESVTTEDIHISDGKVDIALGGYESTISWHSRLKKEHEITLSADKDLKWSEVWKIDASSQWHLETEGLAKMKLHNRQLPVWKPRSGEKLKISISKPEAIIGPTKTVENISLDYNPGKGSANATLEMEIRSSIGDTTKIVLPKNAKLESVQIDGIKKIVSRKKNEITIPLQPGKQKVTIFWKDNSGFTFIKKSPKITLDEKTNNISIDMKIPDSRWVLFIDGPRIGPVMVVWSIVIVLLIISFALGRIKAIPLKSYHWALILIGLGTMTNLGRILIVAWFIALWLREKYHSQIHPKAFNTMQVLIAVLTFLTVFTLMVEVPFGLLNPPNMMITGNGSSNLFLSWYQDHSINTLPHAMVISLPIWVFRLSMLLWALWFAYKTPSWAKWGWKAFSTGIIWNKTEEIYTEDLKQNTR